MNKSEYEIEVLEDAKEWMEENISYYDNFEDAYYELELVVSGNDNGSYYCNTYKAQEALEGVIFDSSIQELLRFYLDIQELPISRGAETCDVLVRIVLLQDNYSELERFFNELKEAA